MEGKSKTGLPRVRASSALPGSWQGFGFFTGEEGHIGGTALLPEVLAPLGLGMRPTAPRPRLVTAPHCPLVPIESLPAPDVLLTPQLPELPANGPTHPRALCVGGWGPQAEDRPPRAPCEGKPGPTRAGGDAKGRPRSWAASDSSQPPPRVSRCPGPGSQTQRLSWSHLL